MQQGSDAFKEVVSKEFSFFKQECSENQITMLQQREAKLLGDRRQLEKSVNILTNKIAELEDMLQKPRSEKQPTHERGSQTDLGAGSQLTSTMIQGSHQGTQENHGSTAKAKLSFSGARLCNSLPVELKDITNISLTSFKNKF